MTFKYHFELQPIAGMFVAVATGKDAEKFSGVIKLNESGAKIFAFLQEGKSAEEAVDEMQKIFDAPADVIMADVHKIINMLKEKGLATD
ncbi:MAG: PqqD family protein [Bacteroidales bacterium]|nr:PqqD family protein [Bacteroidales bacterium]